MKHKDNPQPIPYLDYSPDDLPPDPPPDIRSDPDPTKELTANLKQPSAPLSSPQETFLSLSNPSTRNLLEAEMLDTFRSIMKNEDAAPTHRLNAAKEVGELLGKYTEANAARPPQLQTNTQINILDDPSKSQALIDGLKKARSIASGSDSGTRPLRGGRGV